MQLCILHIICTRVWNFKNLFSRIYNVIYTMYACLTKKSIQFNVIALQLILNFYCYIPTSSLDYIHEWPTLNVENGGQCLSLCHAANVKSIGFSSPLSLFESSFECIVLILARYKQKSTPNSSRILSYM